LHINLSKYFTLSKWKVVICRHYEKYISHNLRAKTEKIYKRNSDEYINSLDKKNIIIEGYWDNPNHWFRLYLFLKAINANKKYNVLGLLNKKSDKSQKKTFQSLGVNSNYFIGSCEVTGYIKKAKDVLRNVKKHEDLLKLKLPNNLPAYIFYDTVLKEERNPQPPLSSGIWLRVLSETLRNIDIYNKLLFSHKIYCVVLSHAWKSEYATLCWLALLRNTPVYIITACYESIRIRRLTDIADYTLPVEHMNYSTYTMLPEIQRKLLVNDGESYLKQSGMGQIQDINNQYAYKPENRVLDIHKAKEGLGIDINKKIIVVYAHAWFDFPHIFGMKNFTDYMDWIFFTYEVAKKNDSVHWLFKAHPCDLWYGGVRLNQLINNTPLHISVCNEDVDSLTIQNITDVAITMHGTIGIEAVARGIPVITADNSPYSDWDFTYTAKSKDEYRELLLDVRNIEPPSNEMKRDALAYLAITHAPSRSNKKLIKLRCDSSGSILYKDIIGYFNKESDPVMNEINNIKKWIDEDNLNYSIYSRLSSSA